MNEKKLLLKKNRYEKNLTLKIAVNCRQKENSPLIVIETLTT